jgi:hypothetical protein
MTRPSDTIKAKRSHLVVWKGTEPHIEASHWQPGYTDAHRESVGEALGHAMADVLQETALVREKWIKLQLLIESERVKAQAEGKDAFGRELIDVMEADTEGMPGSEPDGWHNDY